MRSTSSSRAVTNSTGVQSPSARSRRQISMPSMPGSPTSRMIAAGRSRAIAASAAVAVALDVHAVAGLGEVQPDDVGDRRLVLDHQDQPAGRRARSAGRGADTIAL